MEPALGDRARLSAPSVRGRRTGCLRHAGAGTVTPQDGRRRPVIDRFVLPGFARLARPGLMLPLEPAIACEGQRDSSRDRAAVHAASISKVKVRSRATKATLATKIGRTQGARDTLADRLAGIGRGQGSTPSERRWRACRARPGRPCRHPSAGRGNAGRPAGKPATAPAGAPACRRRKSFFQSARPGSSAITLNRASRRQEAMAKTSATHPAEPAQARSG